MALAFIRVWKFASKNVSSSHRIFLKSQWKVDQIISSERSAEALFVALRAFHRPSGLASSQNVYFCFEPFAGKLDFFLNGFKLSWNTIDGLATVPITSMMETTNRVVLRWRGDPQETPHLPEHFKAWLEISNDDQLDPQRS